MITPGSTNPLLATADAGGYRIERSLRFNSADSAYLNRTPASAGNRQKFTISFWLKRSVIGATDVFSGATAGNGFFLSFPSESAGSLSSTLYLFDNGAASGGWQIFSARVFRDVSAWYHFVIALDTTQSTDSNRIKVYINGIQEDISTWQVGSGASRYPSLNANIEWNNTNQHRIGHANNYGYFNGYITEFYNIDGQQLTPSSFGENDTDTGVWKPKAYSGSYGTNGFYLKFADNSGTTSTTLGKDSSGNGNNWTPNNFYVGPGTTNAEKAGIDSLVDTPTPYGTDTGAGGEVRGNYATLNPLITPTTMTIVNGNLDLSGYTGVTSAYGTFGMSSGKWYFEYVVYANGMGGISGTPNGASYPGQLSDSYAWDASNAGKYNNGIFASYGNATSNGDIVGVAFDADAGTLVFYKNGVSQGTAYSSIPSKTYFPVFRNANSGGNLSINFGQRPFAYTAPSGFKALCTQNLPTPTIGATATTRADDYFDTSLYSGNSSTQTITNSGMQPDFLWLKRRDSGGTHHYLIDAVRGTNKLLFSSLTNAESTDSTYLTSFNSNGFTLGAGDTGTNGTGATYVGWQWKANGAGSSNTQGSITSTVSANTTAGFSIVTYTGNGNASATVGHGLGVTPSMIICKSRSATTAWYVKHTSLASNNNLLLAGTDGQYNVATGSGNGGLGNLSSSTTFGFLSGTSSADAVNLNGGTFVAYCFAAVAGYSAFGSFTGNGSTDGAFVYTGFRPAWVMMKVTSDIGAGGNWGMFDNDRLGYNPAQRDLRANLSNAEGTDDNIIDFLSNGFKIRTTSGGFGGGNGNTYIYAAFAENPFKYSLAR